LAGSGEPTLNPQIDQVISGIKEMTDIPVAVLTNGSLLWREDVRGRIADADIIMPTLTSVFHETFHNIHRPHPELELPVILKGLKELRSSFKGLIHMEVVLLAGFNDSDPEIEGLQRVLNDISPEKIQLNTVVRPPSDSQAKALDNQRLGDIKIIFGEKAEIIAHIPLKHGERSSPSTSNALLEIAKRRPIRAIDLVQILNKSPDDVEKLLKELLIKGAIKRQEHDGEWFYMSA